MFDSTTHLNVILLYVGSLERGNAFGAVMRSEAKRDAERDDGNLNRFQQVSKTAGDDHIHKAI